MKPAPAAADPEVIRLARENEDLRRENQLLRLKVEKLERRQWNPSSERYAAGDGRQGQLFAEPQAAAATAGPARSGGRSGGRRAGERSGPRPLDPGLRRETVVVPDPGLKELLCPETKQVRQPAFKEQLAVLARKPAEYYVKVYERTVFTSAAKSAPVYAPWPTEVLTRSRTHASVVAYVAAAHYSSHQPFYLPSLEATRGRSLKPRGRQEKAH